MALATIPAAQPVTALPHALDERLWELVNKEVDGTATADDLAELNRIFDALEGAEDF